MGKITGNGILLGNGEIKLSKICSDPKHGTWWAIGTHNQWFELRITRTGRIKPGIVHKKSHPYFTFKKAEKANG